MLRRRTGIACLLGVFGGLPVVSQSEVDIRRVTTFAVGRELRLANLTDRLVLGRYGIDGSMQAASTGGATKALVAVRSDEGFAGIAYRIRHDPQLALERLALFARPGDGPGYFKETITRSIAVETLAVLATRVRCRGPPRTAAAAGRDRDRRYFSDTLVRSLNAPWK